MSRILEQTPSPEETVVSRILVMVHQAVDENFPSAENAGRQFTKTVFSEDEESTALKPVPTDEGSATASEGVTPKGGAEASAAKPAKPSAEAPEAPRKEAGPVRSEQPIQKSQLTQLPEHQTASDFEPVPPPDWATRITLALLIAGLVLLAYVLLS